MATQNQTHPTTGDTMTITTQTTRTSGYVLGDYAITCSQSGDVQAHTANLRRFDPGSGAYVVVPSTRQTPSRTRIAQDGRMTTIVIA